MPSPKERLVGLVRSLDRDGSGTVPRAVFEGVMRRVYPGNPDWLEALDFVLAHAEGDEIRYEELFEWIYSETDPAEETGGQIQQALEGPAVVQQEEREETSFDPSRYTDAASLFDALAFTVEGHYPVRLIRMSWLLRQRGLVLRKRQELPEEAFVSADELRAVWDAGGRGGQDKVAPVIAISFCWDTREHPDPTGLQLNLIIQTLEEERSKYSKPRSGFKGFREMGVFWDWPSLLQGDPAKAEEAKSAALREGKSEEDAQKAADEAKRTPAETAAFEHALNETMDLWYAHQATTVFLLTQHPRERGSTRERGYEQSGWTTYERCSAELIKQVFRHHAKWAAVADLGQGAGAAKAGRRWPVGPDQFDALIETLVFTNGSDREVVKTHFRRMSRAQLGSVTKLDFDAMPPPTPEEAAGLGGCLRLCARLEKLDLRKCKIGPAGAEALAGALPTMSALRTLDLNSNDLGDAGARALAGALPSLEELFLHSNGIGGVGAEALAGALRSMPALKRLNLSSNALAEEGTQAVAGALPHMLALQKLVLNSNALGNAGARALAGPLPSVPSLQELHLVNNGIGSDGAEALARALRSTPALWLLDLNGNALGDAGAQALAVALPSVHTLRELRLDSNALDDAGAQAIAGALRSMPALRVMSLNNNGLGDAGARALAGALPSASVLEDLSLYRNGIGKGAKAVLRDAWRGRSGVLDLGSDSDSD